VVQTVPATSDEADRRACGRALSEGYRSILPHGVFPAALLFIEVPPNFDGVDYP